MKPHELEAWVLSIADRVVSRVQVEDSRVELKREWPRDHNKAARRLGGHCNAARGADVLWIVGLDEKEGAVTGAEHNDLAAWLPAIQREFVEIAPPLLLDLNVPSNGKCLSAVLFSSSRSPYVVRNAFAGAAGGGPVESEVPWREGTRVRTARREDLLRILLPAVQPPIVELVRALCRFQTSSIQGSTRRHDIDRSTLWVELMLYVSPRGRDLLAFPEHHRKYHASFVAPDNGVSGKLHWMGPLKTDWGNTGGPAFPQDDRLSRTIDSTPSELLVYGPGMVRVQLAFTSPELLHLRPDQPIRLRVALQMPSADGLTEFRFEQEIEAIVPHFSSDK